MQTENIIEIRTEIVCIDSTSIKVHPDASGARKENGEHCQKSTETGIQYMSGLIAGQKTE